MKKGWEIMKLGELCNIQLGKTPYRKNPKFWDRNKITDNVWLSIADLKHGQYITSSNEHISDIGAKEVVKIPKGTMLLSFKLTLGRVSFAGADLYTNEAIAALIDLDNRLSKYFLFYYFTLFDWDKAAEGDIKVKGKTLNKQKLQELPIIVPPISEQKRIVAILDKAFAAIDKAKANTEKNLQNVRELFESYLEGVFNNVEGEKMKLKEICEISSKLIDPKKKEFQNLIHVGAGNIESKTGELLDLKTAKEENLISGKFLFDESMVLYSKIRPYLMKVVKCDFSGLCSADIYPLKPFGSIVTKEYLYQILLSKDFTDYAILGSQRAGMPKVNREHLFEYEVKVPSIEQQNKIVKKLEYLNCELKRAIIVYETKINSLLELKKSILGKAFIGGLN